MQNKWNQERRCASFALLKEEETILSHLEGDH